jgi:hypothetical protein
VFFADFAKKDPILGRGQTARVLLLWNPAMKRTHRIHSRQAVSESISDNDLAPLCLINLAKGIFLFTDYIHKESMGVGGDTLTGSYAGRGTNRSNYLSCLQENGR